MKRFKTKKKISHYIDLIVIIILITTLVFLHYYNQNISKKMLDIASSKLEEISTLYIKRYITPKNTNLDNLININTNSSGEIINVDINMNYGLELMLDAVNNIQNSIFDLEAGNIKDFKNANELKSYKGNLFISVPLCLADNGLLFSNLGPKIPVKISFFEHALGNIETSITEYGINNALLKVYLVINFEQKLIIPYKEEKFVRNYDLLIGAKVINGKVPSIYGTSMNTKSNIIPIED